MRRGRDSSHGRRRAAARCLGTRSGERVPHHLGLDHVDDHLGDVRRVVGHALEEARDQRSEEHTSELQSPCNLVCRLLLEKKKKTNMKDVRWTEIVSMMRMDRRA